MEKLFYRIALYLDGIVYGLIDYLYNIFDFLAKLNLFGNEDYQEIVRRLYLIIGLVMLFVLAYALLRAIINPEEFSKGDTSIPKIIRNIITSMIIIAVLPTVFSVAFNLQYAILNNNVIPQLILDEKNIETSSSTPGREMAFYTFQAFFHVNDEDCKNKENVNECIVTKEEEIKTDDGKESLKDINYKVLYEKLPFGHYKRFAKAVEKDKIEYMFLISTIAGVFIAYVLMNFCFDLAIRVIKLMFYQMIAPIPAICRAVPFGGLKDVFNKWVKNITSTFLDIFIRIAVINLGVYLISKVVPTFNDFISSGNYGGLTRTGIFIAQALVIMGCVAFIRQAPKLLGDLFGISTGDMKLGLADKLAMGGGLFAGAAVGGAVTSGGRNLVGGISNTVKNLKKMKEEGASTGERVKAAFKGARTTFGSTVAGFASGGARSGYGARNAKNFKEMRDSASKGAAAAGQAKAKRAAYRAEHKGATEFDTLLNVGMGHVSDAASSVGAFFGIGGVDDYIDDNKVIDSIAAKKKAVRTAAEGLIDGEANKSSSSFYITAKDGTKYSATELRSRLLAIQDAKSGQLFKDETVDAHFENGVYVPASTRRVQVTAAEAQREYDSYRYNFTQAIQNLALDNDTYEAIDRLKDEDGKPPKGKYSKNAYAKLAEVSAASAELKGELTRNLDKSYVQEAGFTSQNVNGPLDVSSGPLDAVGDILDVHKAANNREIAKFEEAKRKKSDGK